MRQIPNRGRSSLVLQVWGKHSFALCAARAFFESGEFVVLYYKNAVWAFSKKKGVGEDAKQMLSVGLGLKKAPQPDGNDLWFARFSAMPQ